MASEPIFSEFEVANPETKRTYRVAIRGQGLGENFCSCPDFAVNTLGHLQAHRVRAGQRLAPPAGRKKRPGAGPSSRRISEVYLQYGANREVVFRPGTDCPAVAQDVRPPVLRRPRPAEARGVRPVPPSFCRRPASTGTSSAATTTAWDTIAQVRDQAHLAERIAEAFPRGIRSKAFAKLLEGAALSVPARRGVVRRQGRPLADRRRHGPGQDDPGHRRRRDPRPRPPASSACWSSRRPR